MQNKYNGKTLLCRTDYNGQTVTGRISMSTEAVDVKIVGLRILSGSKAIVPYPCNLKIINFALSCLRQLHWVHPQAQIWLLILPTSTSGKR